MHASPFAGHLGCSDGVPMASPPFSTCGSPTALACRHGAPTARRKTIGRESASTAASIRRTSGPSMTPRTPRTGRRRRAERPSQPTKTSSHATRCVEASLRRLEPSLLGPACSDPPARTQPARTLCDPPAQFRLLLVYLGVYATWFEVRRGLLSPTGSDPPCPHLIEHAGSAPKCSPSVADQQPT